MIDRESLARNFAAVRVRAADAARRLPAHCVFCGDRVAAGGHRICDGCRADLPLNVPACPRCAAPLGPAESGVTPCTACLKRPPPFVAAVAPLRYAYPVDAALRAFKFRGRLWYAPAFGKLMADAAAGLVDDVDAVLPVPLHWRRHAVRGFNQADELVKPLRRATRLPLLRNVRRVRATPYQSGLDHAARRRNLDRAFAVHGIVCARHILVVDDVITTGSTCARLAECLLENGVEKVSVLAMARAGQGQR